MSGDLLKFHQWCISDPVAMSAYREAIRKTVRSGDVVLDLGSGTGILGYFACEAGAAKVYAVEPTGWTVVSAARPPDYLAYFNELAGSRPDCDPIRLKRFRVGKGLIFLLCWESVFPIRGRICR